MNFDGTYPEQPEISEKQRMIENADPQQQQTRPPVRVIVSYPQSEEWDGKPIHQWRKYYFWLGVGILVFSVAFGIFYVIGKGMKTSPENSGLQENSLVKTPVDHRILVMEYILNYYEERTHGENFHTQLEFYKNEFNKLYDTDDFLVDFNIPFKYLTFNETNDIRGNIMEHLVTRKFCLTKLTEEENFLSSYEFQNKLYSRTESELENCSEEEQQHLEKLRADYLTPLTVTRENNSLIVFNKVIILKKIKKLLDPIVKKLTIIASILYLDTDITQNIDMAVFAETWKFITSVELNLSGPNGQDYRLDVPDSQPGKSGSDAGFFLAVGLENVDNETMMVRMDGGNASDGHDGPDGRNGTAGVLPGVILEGERHCVVPVQEPVTNPAGEVLQMHAVFDETACAEAGGLGGRAGFPGRAGEAVLIGFDFLTYRGTDGATAKNGINGKNGSSILGECYSLAYKYHQFQNEPPTWQTITQPSCHPEKPYKLPLIPNRKTNQTLIPKITPPKTIKIFQQSLQTFTNIARKNFKTRPELFKLLQKIESSEHLAKANTVPELENEFNELEKTYDHIEIFQSFARKIAGARKAMNCEELVDLEAMVWSKIATLNTRFGVNYVVDIESYLQEVLNSLNRLETNRESYVTQVKKKQKEVIKKLKETRALLTGYPENNETVVSITVQILPEFVDILTDLLEEKTTEKSYINFQTIVKNWNEKLDKDCRKDKINSEQLLTLEKCTGNRPIDRKLLEIFEAIRRDSPVDGIAKALNVIEHELQPSLATTAIEKKQIMHLRQAVLDLSSLLFRIRQNLSESKLAKIIVHVSKTPEKSEKSTGMQKRFVKNLLYEQYLKALDAYKQWAFPYCDIKDTVTPDVTKEELILATQTIINTLKSDRSTIQARDSRVIEAQFRLSSPIAPFFSWTRQDYDYEITQLLTGRRTQLRANIVDSVHGLSKQAIKFRTAEIFLEGVPKSITKNFVIHLTHSGFSHFLYNGTMTTIVGPEIEIVHSLDFGRNGEPKVQNNVYQKIKAGDVFLSPFTTWYVQLKPLNQLANFDDLVKHTGNVHLVGIGRYTTL